MKINANDVYDLLREHAETYADAKCTLETYNALANIKHNPNIDIREESLEVELSIAKASYEKLRKTCELQKDEEEELEELLKVKDETVIYRAIILYTKDLGVD
jgi:hypothetical protein